MSANISIKANAVDLFSADDLSYFDHYGEPKGLALIINNHHFGGDQDRHGSHIDVLSMHGLLKELGYEIRMYQDLTCTEMLESARRYVLDFNEGDYKSCIVVLMTHGFTNDQGEELYACSEDSVITQKEFMLPIIRHGGAKLKSRPKIFFIEACRIMDSDPSPSHGRPPRSDMPIKTTAAKETAIFCATLPGAPAYRHREYGSLFINALCNVLRREAHDPWFHIHALNAKIVAEACLLLGDYVQVSTAQIHFTKKFHFFPVETVVNGYVYKTESTNGQ